MSDDWITKGDRLQKAVGTSLSREIQSKGYTRLLSNIKPDGTIFYTTLDSNAKPLIKGASL